MPVDALEFDKLELEPFAHHVRSQLDRLVSLSIFCRVKIETELVGEELELFGRSAVARRVHLQQKRHGGDS